MTDPTEPPPPAPPAPRIGGVVVPVAAVAVALAAGLIASAVAPQAGRYSSYALFAIAVAFSGALSGFRAGVAATLLGASASAFFHLHPLYSLRVDDTGELVTLGLFLLEGVALSGVSSVLGRVEVGQLKLATRYGIAVATVTGVVLFKLSIAAVLPAAVPFMLFYATVMFAAWVGGFGPGGLATMLCGLSAAYFFSEPRFSFQIGDPDRAAQLGLFILEGGFISAFSGTIEIARRRATASEQAARQYWGELRATEQRLRRQNQVLGDLARRPLLDPADSDDRFPKLTEVAATTVDAERASVWVFDEKRQALRCLDLFERSTERHSSGAELRVEDYPAYFRAIEENRCLPAHDARTDPRTREFLTSYLEPLAITSMLDAPIRLGGAVVGVVCIEHTGPPRQWAVEEEQFAGSVADFVALALKQRELRAAGEYIRRQASLLDQARDAIIVEDLAGRAGYWNGGAEHLYGWPAAEVTGEPIMARIQPTGVDEARAAVDASGEWAGEVAQRARDGRPLVVACRWTLVRGADGRPSGRLVIATDLTDRKALEQKLTRAQRMESIGALAGGIAHDLNNLLTPVLMGADLIRTITTSQQREALLDTIRASAERGAALLRQILSFARGAGTATGPVDVRAVVRLVADMLTHTLPKQVELLTSIPWDLWAVTGSPTQLDQVLMNLCVNARDAMPAGGTLRVSAENRELGPGAEELPRDRAPGGFVALTVADTGTGIPPEVIDKIFDPFFTTKEPGKGTGLGLATTREVVASLGGFLRVRSRIGAGTTFTVFLPAAEAVVPVAKPDSKETPIGFGELVLVVDDEASVLELVRRVLETYGYRVATATNGAEAVARATASSGDLRAVLLDMMMPGQTLAETLAGLRAVAPLIPVILTTGMGGDAEADPPGMGETAFLPKPYTTSQVLRTVRKVIGPPNVPQAQ